MEADRERHLRAGIAGAIEYTTNNLAAAARGATSDSFKTIYENIRRAEIQLQLAKDRCAEGVLEESHG